jgi:hypothetical protein
MAAASVAAVGRRLQCPDNKFPKFQLLRPIRTTARIVEPKVDIAKDRATPRLPPSGDRLCTLLNRLVVSSERETELLPYRNHGVS